MGLGPISDRGLWSLFGAPDRSLWIVVCQGRPRIHSLWSAGSGMGPGIGSTDRDPLLGWNCYGLGLGVLEPFWSDPGDVGAARASRTLAVLCCLSSRILSVGLGLLSDRGLWSLLLPRTDFCGSPTVHVLWSTGSGMYPGIGSTDRDPLLG